MHAVISYIQKLSQNNLAHFVQQKKEDFEYLSQKKLGFTAVKKCLQWLFIGYHWQKPFLRRDVALPPRQLCLF